MEKLLINILNCLGERGELLGPVNPSNSFAEAELEKSAEDDTFVEKL